MPRKIKAVPRAGDGKCGPDGYLGYLVRRAHVVVRAAMDKALAELGVTSPQFGVLTMTGAYPGLSGADLARLTFLTPQTINLIVGNLVKAGAVGKSADPVHGSGLGDWSGVRRRRRCAAGWRRIAERHIGTTDRIHLKYILDG